MKAVRRAPESSAKFDGTAFPVGVASSALSLCNYVTQYQLYSNVPDLLALKLNDLQSDGKHSLPILMGRFAYYNKNNQKDVAAMHASFVWDCVVSQSKHLILI